MDRNVFMLQFIWLLIVDKTIVSSGCRAGVWGRNCTNPCGHCHTDPVVCDQMTGNCASNRCANGYMGLQCMTECDPGHYGGECSGKCGHCRVFPCDFITGRCINDDCVPGYQGLYCNSICSPETFGYKCQDQCGHCIDNDVCNAINGTCPNGCQDGFQGSTCKTGRGTSTTPHTPSSTTRQPLIIIVVVVVCGVLLMSLIAGAGVCLLLKTGKRRVRNYEYHHYESCTLNRDSQSYCSLQSNDSGATYERPITHGTINTYSQSYDFGRVAESAWYEEIRD